MQVDVTTKCCAMKTLTHSLACLLLALASFSALAGKGAEDDNKKPARSNAPNCVEVTARPLINGEPISGVSIVLYCGNEEVMRIDSTEKSKTEFTLKRDQYYTVEIKRPGYAPRLVGIYTNIPAAVPLKPLFRYEFEVEMAPQLQSTDDFYLDFPVALVSFNKKNEAFEPHKKYLKVLKKEMAKAKTGSKASE